MPLGDLCLISPVFCLAKQTGSATFASLFSDLTSWVVESSSWAWHELGAFLAATSSPTVVTGTAQPEYDALVSVAPLVALCALVANVLGALRHGDPGALVRDALLAVPVLALATLAAVPFATMILTIVNQLSSVASVHAAAALRQLTNEAGRLPSTVPDFGVMLLDLAGVVGALLLWFELVLRNAVLALLLCLSPLVMAASLWKPVRRLASRLVETFVAVALSKFVVVVALAMGVLATQSSGVSVQITGIAVVLLAVLVPFTLLRLIPLLDQSALHAADGLRQRASAGARRASSAASSAVTAMSPAHEPRPPTPSEDLGLDDWPASETMTPPEPPSEPPEPPIGEPQLRRGKVAYLRDKFGPVLGWHFDE